jgi:hypothetical protein
MLKGMNDEVESRQNKDEQRSRKQPTGICQIKIEVIERGRDQCVKGNRHGRKDNDNFKEEAPFNSLVA